MSLSSFGNDLTVAIVGATGGIGNALLQRLSSDPAVSRILALARESREIESVNADRCAIELADPHSIRRAVLKAGRLAPYDLVFVATGMLHRGQLEPEKSMGEIEFDRMRDVLETNTIGPAVLAAGILPLMRANRKSVFAVLSARVGSIGDNRLGGWISYRSSKAALNMVIRTLSIEQARKNPNCAVVALHPGTVDTGLSAPFTTRLAADQLVAPERAARNLLFVVDGLAAEDTGGFFAWDGSRIEF